MRLDSGLEAFVNAADFRTVEKLPLGSLMGATVLSAQTDRQQVKLTSATGAAATYSVQREALRALAHRLGLINLFADVNNQDRVKGLARAGLPQRLAAAQKDVPWMAWARLSVKVARQVAKIIGTGQVARPAIEAETGVVVSADSGEIYLLAPSTAALEGAIEGVRRRMGWVIEVEEDVRGESHDAGDWGGCWGCSSNRGE